MLKMEHEQGINRSAGKFCDTTTRRKETSGVNESMQYPRFYKIVTPCMVQNAIPNCKMVLPSTFVRTYLANIEGPQTMVLESFASGWEWQVMYTNESFEEGWQVFSTDYDLDSGDLIKFQLKVEFRFTVQVYNKFGCEKFSCFDVGASNMWMWHRATAASEGGSQDCIDKRELSLQILNIRGKVDEKFMAAIIEKHQKRRRINSMLPIAPKSEVITGADFGRSHNDIEQQAAVRYSMTCKRDHHHVKGKQASHFMWRQFPSTSQMLAKGFIERAKRTMNLRVRMKPHVSWLEYKRKLLKLAKFLPQITPESTDERAEQSADNINRTTRKSASETQGFCSEDFIEQVKATRISRLSEDKRNLSTSGQTVNPCAGGTSERPECDTLVEMKPDVTNIDITKWKSINIDTSNNSENQHQDIAGTPAKRGRGRPRKCPVHDEPAIKPIVLTPGFQRVDRETTPVEEVEEPEWETTPLEEPDRETTPFEEVEEPEWETTPIEEVEEPERETTRIEEVEEPERDTTPIEEVAKPAKRKRGRPPIHHKQEWRQAGTTSSVQQGRVIFVSQRRPVTESEKDDAVAAAYSAAARMQSPCIVFILKPSSVYKNFALFTCDASQRFPTKFASQRMPRETRVVRVCDSEWNAWSCWWNPLYHHISGREWRSFALEHCLEEGDACVFEILEDIRENFTMMVHIFRVAGIPAGQTAWDSHICPHNCVPDDSSYLIAPIERKSFVDWELGPPPKSPRNFTSTLQDNNDNKKAESRGVKTKIDVDSGMTEAISKKPVQEKPTKGGPSNFGLSLDDIISGTETAGLSDQQLRNPKKGIANEKDFYTVGRLCNRKMVRNSNIFLVELDGVVPPMPHVKSKDCKPDGNGNWWVHERNFTRDFRYCHIP